MPDARMAERMWRGDGVGARAARAALAPVAWLFGTVVRVRNVAFDVGLLPAHAGAIPAVSIGNLSVGGTGKTPMAAWTAAALLARGARPAIVLRGYGDDEPRVHATLNPGVPVIVAPDRVEGIARAAAAGATVAVLDDAFQHRRARRGADVVLVSADAWHEPVRLLPAGPWREPLSSLRRASVVVVTRKAASGAASDALVRRLQRSAPDVPFAQVHLAPDLLRMIGGDGARAVGTLRGQRVLAIAGIGEPAAFAAQLGAVGATVTLRAFADHHAFTDADAASLAADARGVDVVCCTLKDAVKLAPRWPARGPALWYVSQRVVVEEGADVMAGLLDRLLSVDRTNERPAGSTRLQSPTHGH